MKHKKLFVAVIAIMLVLCLSMLAAGQSLWQTIGEEDQQSEKYGEQTTIAYIQGEEFTVNSGHLETSYSYYQKTPETMDEAGVREYYVANELLYREAQAQGLNASPEEVDQHIAYLREVLPDDPEGYAEFCDYLKGRGMTEDEYWKESWDVYQMELTIEKLGEKLMDEYYAQYPDATADEYQAYYRNEYRPQLFDKYQVEML